LAHGAPLSSTGSADCRTKSLCEKRQKALVQSNAIELVVRRKFSLDTIYIRTNCRSLFLARRMFRHGTVTNI
jgi:hypothetical protein